MRTTKAAYILLLAATLAAGAVATPKLAWEAADTAIALMTVLNLLFLLLQSREVREETNRLLAFGRGEG